MGREHELREAAQEGNITKLETLLSVKKSALMSSWRKGININCQDQNGNTALHLAALNGKKDAVIYLLQNDASANIPDLSGNYPLHLAAFNGHHEVANVLINQGPSRANVIEQNLAGDTALHIAAQYGHTQVVQILLECHADGNMRNLKEESPLDLAAMYGRISTVQVLVLSDPTLVRASCDTHSPLHLSARNGHTSVIETLLDFGMSVNVMCDRGTALHEAALFGKVDAVRLLLNRGVDVNARNADDVTVLDLLVDLPSERSHEITSLIYEQSQMMPAAQSTRSKSMSFVNEEQAQASRRQSKTGEKNDNARDSYSIVGAQTRSATMSERRPDKNAVYTCIEYPRISRLGSSLNEASISPLPTESSQDEIFDDQFLREARTEMPSESVPPTKPKRTTLDTKARTAEPNAYEEYQVPGSDAGKVSQQKKADAAAVNQLYDVVPPSRPAAGSVTSQSSRESIPSFPPPSSAEALETLRQLTGINQTPNLDRNADVEELPIYENTAPPQVKPVKPVKPQQSTLKKAPKDAVDNTSLNDFERLHLNMSPPVTGDTYENMKAPGKISDDIYENTSSTRITPEDTYDNIKIRNKPSHTAMDTYDNINITNQVLPTDTSKDLLSFDQPANIPQFETRRLSGVKQKRTSASLKSTPSNGSIGSRPTSTLNESYEWSKIDNILSSLDDLIQADSKDAEQLEVHQEAPPSIGEWLARLGLSYYEASFVANGYDDIRFIGRDMLEEDDLREIGIQNTDHIRVILDSVVGLPGPPRIGDEEFPVPQSVKEWLCKINLADYEARFMMNAYDNMDRIRAIWEFELTTVIGIHLSGHRKRMIHSLGHRPEQTRQQVSWSQKFAAAEAPKTPKSTSKDDAMDLANQLLKAAEDMVTGIEKRRDSRSDSKSPPITKPKSPVSPSSPSSPVLLKYEPSFAWIHKAETLLYDSAIYPTQYLGSHPVIVVRGTQSTLDACKKLTATSKMLQKIPTIQLSISVRGIDFIDAQTHCVISSYDIRNISYCAQDPSDLSVYAYITKDTNTGKHYCHVFKALNLTLGDEIVLTIGQAFELAYHQHRVLVEGAKARKTSDDSSMHSVQNRLNRNEIKSDDKAKSPPPMPKPYSERHNNKIS